MCVLMVNTLVVDLKLKFLFVLLLHILNGKSRILSICLLAVLHHRHSGGLHVTAYAINSNTYYR